MCNSAENQNNEIKKSQRCILLELYFPFPPLSDSHFSHRAPHQKAEEGVPGCRGLRGMQADRAQGGHVRQLIADATSHHGGISDEKIQG